MRAVCWNGVGEVEVKNVPDPTILNPRDAILRVTMTAICGSDLHLYGGYVPTMKRGDILGHEFMGEVVAVGKGVRNLRKGDRVVVPFCIACGNCLPCSVGMTSLCENSNTADGAEILEAAQAYPTAGLFGFSHAFGGYAGGQAELVRVPYADVGAFKVPDELSDEKVLFLGDILPTGYMAAENCEIQPGQIVAVWGCGPVGQFAILSAYALGAKRVIAIDRVPARLSMARDQAKAEVIDFEKVPDVVEALKEMTGGRGPDACIDAVGMEAHGCGLVEVYDYAKQALHLETDRPHVIRQAIQACRPGGVISIPGVYGGLSDKCPMGAAFGKGLRFRMGQTHVHRYVGMLLQRIFSGDLDPSFIITHRLSLDDAPHAYRTFRDKEESCIKVVMKPN